MDSTLARRSVRMVSTQDPVMRLLVGSRFLSRCCRWLAGLTVLVLSAPAQVSSPLQLQSIQIDGVVSVAFTLVDQGSGSTHYTVEFRPGLEGDNDWQTVTEAVITPQGDGYLVQIDSPRDDRGFYRVVGLGGSGGPIVIEFSTGAFPAVEGDTVRPVLVLNQPFNGMVYYTVSGTAASGDYQELSGQVRVNGTTATIPVSLTDNDQIGQLKYLTLRLEAGPGYQLADGTSTTIFIEENDAEWQGSFTTDDATLGFVLRIQQANGVRAARLESAGFGFFPAIPTPTTLLFTANAFSAVATDIPMPAETTLLNEPMLLSLSLNAINGLEGQSVSAAEIEGVGTLISRVPARPHLNTTNSGVFRLLKPPVAPSTNEVELVVAP